MLMMDSFKVSLLCHACYVYERTRGRQRTAAQEEARMMRKEYVKANRTVLKNMPANGKCPRCKRHTTKWGINVFHTRWECKSCVRCTSDTVSSATMTSKPMGVTRPGQHGVCPGCSRIPKAYSSGPHKTQWAWSRYRARFECLSCHKTKVTVPYEAHRTSRLVPKSTDGRCPRCSRKPTSWRFSQIRNRQECAGCHRSPSAKPTKLALPTTSEKLAHRRLIVSGQT